jgi:hypothetical protein
MIQYNHIVKAYMIQTSLHYHGHNERTTRRYGWWINELESLGLSIKKINQFNDLDEIRELAEIIKQDKYLDYMTDYFSDRNPSLP